jgi:hypothetical protein
MDITADVCGWDGRGGRGRGGPLPRRERVHVRVNG